METSTSGTNHNVIHAQNDRWGLGPMETSFQVLITMFFMHKTTNEGRDQQRLVILMLKTLLWMHKTTDEGWDQ